MTTGLLSFGTSAYVGASGGGWQVNTNTEAYYTGNSAFFNIWTIGSTMTLVSSLNGTLVGKNAWNAVGTASAGGGTAYFNNSTGELNNPCPSDVTSIGRGIFTPPPNYPFLTIVGNPWWYGAVINVSWAGTSTPTLSAGSTHSTLNVTGAHSATITLGNSTGTFNLGVNFSVSNFSDPPHNIVMSYASETQFGTTPITTNFANLIKQFGWLRTMKWTGGGASFQSDISQFADANFNSLAQPFSYSGWPTVQSVGINSDYGPKAGLHPSVICTIANALGVNPWYNIPVATSNSCMTSIASYFAANLNPNLKVLFEYGNETAWAFGTEPTTYVGAQVYPGTGTTGAFTQYTGYRAAQLWQIAHDTFGTGGRSRWLGAISGQQVSATSAQNVITGAQYYLANSAPLGTLLTDLFDVVITSNYFGNGASSVTITGASAVGATTTLTTSSNPTSKGFTTGTVVRLFFSVTTAGTLGALLNNVDVTISGTTSTSISFTNFGGNSGSGTVSTTGLTYSAGTNYLADGLLFDIMDNSLTNFTNTPATYPTKYSHFATQMWKGIITNAAVDNGCTIQVGAQVPYTEDQQQNALLANSYGLGYRFYEGGLADISELFDTNVPGTNAQFLDYSNNYKFDPGVVGSPYTQAAIMAANNASATSATFSQYPSQFVGMGMGGTVSNPWSPLRSVPGDITNPLWSAITAQNALGPWVDPTLPATGSYSSLLGTTANYTVLSSLVQTVPLTIGTVASNSILVLALESQNNVTPASITVGALGSINVAAPDAVAANNWIYSFVLPTSAGNPTVTVTWGAGDAFSGRCVSAYLLQNLASTSVLTTATGSQIANVNATKGAAVIASANWSPVVGTITGGYVTVAGSGVGLISPVIQCSGTNYGASALFNFTFSSQIMPLYARSGGVVVATYR